MLRYFVLLTLAAFAALLSSCASSHFQVDPEWTEEMFFKNAQDAMDENRYETALYYYEVFLVRYPEDKSRVLAAEYELAFIHYKSGDLKTAQVKYEAIIRKYDESPYAMLFHPRFRQLCEIGLTNIEKRRVTDNRLFWRAREKQWAEKHDEKTTDDDL